ncbi:MAG: YihY/virulence factor BrkB family protein [Candidatus Marinimicrobia bacterium]|nr:YihY/virulence factor BrkB family protein [Candidatus Neomarinimicrobiota bacterium]MCF7828522.1 YihY/virulence factor BrkB family protein [Candidatus Neomarinimicrobiota bacterium]MCF7882055.1 YihY/virulence factor BrkB family protein [Candidatus Neomarinimicrobiota bacterium]
MNRNSFLTSLRQPAEKLSLWFRHQLFPAFGYALKDFFITDRVPNLAASLAFFTLLSFIPLVVLITASFGYVMESSEVAYQQVLDLLTQIAPHSVSSTFPMINELISLRFTAGWIGALVLLWAGSRVFDILESSLNRVWTLREDRPFLKKTGLALVLVPGMALFLGASLGLSTLYSISQKFEIPWLDVRLEDIPVFWNLIGNLIPIIVSVMGFYIVYRLIAAAKVHPKDALIGALTAGLLWEIIKRGYDYWVSNIWQVSAIFGGLGTLAVFVIWVYLSCMILLFGAEVAYNWQLVEEGREDDYGYFDPE